MFQNYLKSQYFQILQRFFRFPGENSSKMMVQKANSALPKIITPSTGKLKDPMIVHTRENIISINHYFGMSLMKRKLDFSRRRFN